jgi:hypothetical protein
MMQQRQMAWALVRSLRQQLLLMLLLLPVEAAAAFSFRWAPGAAGAAAEPTLGLTRAD